MAAATVIRFKRAGDRSWRVGRNLLSDPANMTAGANVTDGDVDLVAVPPAGVSVGDGSPHSVALVHDGSDGVAFDPATVCAAFHASDVGLRIFGSSSGPKAWTHVYVLSTPAARTI